MLCRLGEKWCSDKEKERYFVQNNRNTGSVALSLVLSTRESKKCADNVSFLILIYVVCKKELIYVTTVTITYLLTDSY